MGSPFPPSIHAPRLYRVVEVVRVERGRIKKVAGPYHRDIAWVRHNARFIAEHTVGIDVYVVDDTGQRIADVGQR